MKKDNKNGCYYDEVFTLQKLNENKIQLDRLRCVCTFFISKNGIKIKVKECVNCKNYKTPN